MNKRKEYETFCQLYGIKDIDLVERLYDIYELLSFLPSKPSEKEKRALQKLIGITQDSGYLDYQSSNNTFELIMQWREETENFGENHFLHTSSQN